MVYEGVEEVGMGYGWEVMKDEKRKMKEGKGKGESYEGKVFRNGDRVRELLGRRG